MPGGTADPDSTAFVSTSEVEWVAECSPEPSVAPEPGETFRDCPFAPEMVVVPAGRFVMGTPETEALRWPNEGPQREVVIASPFAIGVYEVTQDQWRVCSRVGRCATLDDKGRRVESVPASNFNWHSAHDYAEWLSEMTGRTYRLPSEAEWEYAARAGEVGPRNWAGRPQQACASANVRDRSVTLAKSIQLVPVVDCNDGHLGSSPVGSFPPNAFGLYDVLGNVMEWTQDCYQPSYADAPTDSGAHEQELCALRVLRGGSFGQGIGRARFGYRQHVSPLDEFNSYGVRVVLDLETGSTSAAAGELAVHTVRSSRHELTRGVEPLVATDQAPWEARTLAAARVRQLPHPDSPALATLASGTPIDVVRELPSWIEVALPGEGKPSPTLGYVARSNVGWVVAPCVPEDDTGPRRVGEVFRDCAFSPRLVVLPAGRFTMGSPETEPGRTPDDLPPREVVIEAPFAIGVHEVTQLEWAACVRSGACPRANDEGQRDPRRPVVNVSWSDGQAYAAWLSELTAASYRLPFEHEWEYAARAGTQTSRYWGDEAEEVCEYENTLAGDLESAHAGIRNNAVARCRDGFIRTAPVGSFLPNAFGIHDALGNVMEWTQDCYTVSTPDDAARAPALPDPCIWHMLRGGSYFSACPARAAPPALAGSTPVPPPSDSGS